MEIAICTLYRQAVQENTSKTVSLVGTAYILQNRQALVQKKHPLEMQEELSLQNV
jgi:hypothetical protein